MEQKIFSSRRHREDEVNFELFYNQYYALFISFALKFCPDRESCRDIVSEVFIQYWKRREDFQDIVSIKVFFYKSIRNECINLWKRRQVHDKFVNRQLQHISEEEYFLDNIIREEVAFTVHEKIKELSGMERRVLALAMDGKSNDDIAAELEISINTVKTYKARAYAALRVSLQSLRLLLTLI